jgi:hypothetical protein
MYSQNIYFAAQNLILMEIVRSLFHRVALYDYTPTHTHM